MFFYINDIFNYLPKIVKRKMNMLAVLSITTQQNLINKEIWVENAYKFRDPDLDLPSNWINCRNNLYQKYNIPLNPISFIEKKKSEVLKALEKSK